MSQVEYFGGIPQIHFSPFPFPEKEYMEKRSEGEESLKKWCDEYRFDLIRYFQFEKKYHDYNIYKEDVGEI